MTGALAVRDEIPDLLGTSPADLNTHLGDQPQADVITARQRAERIRAELVRYVQMRQDIADAYAQRDWAALGYSSWFTYLEGEFGPELQQLGRNRAERREAVRDLRAQRLSTRQIGAALGVDPKTVRNDLPEQPADSWHCQTCSHSWLIVPGESNECPACGGRGSFAPATVTGADGKTYPSRRTPRSATASPAAEDAGDEQSPAGAAATAGDPRPLDRPGSAPIDSPAGRDHEETTEPGEAVSPAVATPGQPGDSDTASPCFEEVAGPRSGLDKVGPATEHPQPRDLGAIGIGGRTRLRVRVGQLDADDVPHCWLSVEDTVSGTPLETLALTTLQVGWLLGRLRAAHDDMQATQGPIAL